VDIGRVHLGIREFSVGVWGVVGGTVVPLIAPHGINGDERYAVGALVVTGLGVVSSWLPRSSQRGRGGPPPEIPEGIPLQRGQIADPGRVIGHVAPLANLTAALANHLNTRAIVTGGLGLGKTMLAEKAGSSMPVKNCYGDRIFEARCTNAADAASVWASIRDAVWGSGSSRVHDPVEICDELARHPSVLVLDGLDLAITEDRAATLDVLTRLTDCDNGESERLALVVTVRDLPTELGQWAEYHLDPLTDQESLRLFDHAAEGQYSENAKAVKLVARMDGVALALVLLGRIVKVDGLHKTVLWYQRRGTDILEDPDPSHRTPSWQVVIDAALQTDFVGERGRRLAAVLAEQSSGLGRALLSPHGLWLDRVAAEALVHLGLCQFDHDRLWCLAPIRDHIVRHHPLPIDQRTEVGVEAFEILSIVASSAREDAEHRAPKGRLSGVEQLIGWLGPGTRNDDAVMQLGFASWPGDFLLDDRLAAICRAEPGDARQAEMAAELMDREFRRSCYEASAGWAKHLADMARDEVDTTRALRGLAEIARLTGDNAGAVVGYTKALVMCRDIGDRSGEASALRGLADVARFTSDFAGAVDGYTKALVILREIGDRSVEAIALHGFAGVARVTGDFAGAVVGYTKALVMCRDIGDRYGEANALSGLAGVARLTGDTAGAGDGYTKALVMCRDIGDRYGEAIALNGLADVARVTSDFANAVDGYTKALVMCRDIGDRYGEAIASSGLADVARVTGDSASAVDGYTEALAISRDIGDRSGEARALYGLAEVARVTGDFAGAVDGHTEALVIYQDIGNRHGEASALHGLGLASGRIDALEGAADLYSRIGQHAQAATFWKHLWTVVSDEDLRMSYLERAITDWEAAGQSSQADELRAIGRMA
jgi:tetratricopeptide (TPR) repeat protein